jgi:hypothetical protein
VKEYKDDVKEFETLAANKQLEYLSETRSAKALSKRIDKLVADLDSIVQTLDKNQDVLKKDIKVGQRETRTWHVVRALDGFVFCLSCLFDDRLV